MHALAPEPLDHYTAAYAWRERFRADCVRTVAAAIADPTGPEARTIAALPSVHIAGYGAVSMWSRPAIR